MIEIVVKDGQTLWQAMKENGIVVDRPCGGNGLCQGCMVEVKGIGEVRSCQFAKVGVYEVELSKELQAGDGIVAVMDRTSIEGRRAIEAVMDAAEKSDGIKKAKDTAEGGESHEDVMGAAESDVDIEEIMSSAEWSVESGQKGFDELPVIAVDIGTTTVALKLLYRGEEYASGFINPQRQFGADVMSRIQAANGGALLELQKVLKERLYQEIEEVLDEALQVLEGNEELKMIISANTTMQHLFRGLSCEGLGKYPFSPVTLELEREYDVKNFKAETIYLPGISTYVGADIVSGIYALDMLAEEQPVLLLDLGTNGEMALGCKGKLLVASAAAGPAFEGSPLAMRLHASGIMKVLHEMLLWKYIDENGTLVDKYFEEGYPVEISCELVQRSIKNVSREEEPGSMRNVLPEKELGSLKSASNWEEPQDMEKVLPEKALGNLKSASNWEEPQDMEKVLPEKALGNLKNPSHGETEGDKLRITQGDIREIQMAKAAIRAGIEMLLAAYGIAPSEVSKVYLAGGMGYYLEPEDAVAIGLLPKEFLQGERIFSVGNTSLQGAIRFAREEEAGTARLWEIKILAKEIVLANTKRFQDLYLKYMSFSEDV